jgi:Ca2+-binding RTX toxin-like protein
VRATDAAGNTDATPASYTWTINAAPAEKSASVIADPQNPGQSLLLVVGSQLGDKIAIKPLFKGSTDVLVTLNGQQLGVFPSSAFQSIVVHGLDGNDTIAVNAKVVKPSELHGDGGNDVLTGSSLNDVLYGDDGNDQLMGNAGNDQLFGGAGDDVLIGHAGDDVLDAGLSGNDVLSGGNGTDTLIGSSGANVLIGGVGADAIMGDIGSDIVISGKTGFDTNATALKAIMAEWKRTDISYHERIDHLTGKTLGGLNGKYILTATKVTSDTNVDAVFGDAGQDWFWAPLSEIGDLEPGELVQ